MLNNHIQLFVISALLLLKQKYLIEIIDFK